METKRQRMEKIRSSLDIERSSWIPHWRELSNYVLPRRARFLITDYNKGTKKHNNIVDSTATLALRTLKSGMMSGITSPARPWFQLTAPDPDMNEYGPVKEWLYSVTARMRDVFLKSNIYNSFPTLYGDIGLFGTSPIGIMEDTQDVIRTIAFPIGSYWVSTNEFGIVDTFGREYPMTVRQIVMKFGEYDEKTGKAKWERFSESVKSAWNRGNYEHKFPVCHIVTPNYEYAPGKLSAKYKRYASCYYERTNSSDTMLRESGYDSFPILCPRWDISGEDVYGSSPGMDALGDVKALQVLQKRKSQAIEKQVNPPLLAPTAMRRKRISSIPGDVTYVDVRDGQKGVHSMYDVRFEINGVLEDIREHQDRIKRAFYEDLFLMLAQSDRREITAREIEERHEEKLLALGPVLERLNDELYDPLIDRTYYIMQERGELPPPPEELRDVDLKVEYISIMAQAQKMVGLASTERFMGFVGNLAGAAPEVMDKVDLDQAIDEYGEMSGVSPKIIRTDDEVKAIRAQRAQAQQAAERAQQLEQSAKGAKLLSDTDTNGDNALTRILQGA